MNHQSFLCERLTASLRLTFIKLDSQLKQFIIMRKCEITPQKIIQLLSTNFSALYLTIIYPGHIQCSSDFQNFSWHANFQIDLNTDFWALCWSTFIDRISMEPHILIDNVSHGNRVLELWIQSIMDRFWGHVKFPSQSEDRNRRHHKYNDSSSSSSSSSSATSEDENDEVEEDNHMVQHMNPFRVTIPQSQPPMNNNNNKKKRGRRVEKKKRDPSTSPSSSSFDSDVS
jgi:hypothetical protein